MGKLHTRQKRKISRATHTNEKKLKRKRAKRPKSFMKEETAHAHAKACNLKEGSYTLIKVKKGKKIQIKVN